MVHGEIQMYDNLLELSGLHFLQFIIDNGLYNVKINELENMDSI